MHFNANFIKIGRKIRNVSSSEDFKIAFIDAANFREKFFNKVPSVYMNTKTPGQTNCVQGVKDFSLCRIYPVSILYESIADRYRPAIDL